MCLVFQGLYALLLFSFDSLWGLATDTAYSFGLFQEHFLIIDDERDFVEILSLNLQKIGFKDIIKCYDGTESLAVFERDTRYYSC